MNVIHIARQRAIKKLTTELSVEYGIGILVLGLRFFARIKVVGIRNLTWDDFFAFVGALIWLSDVIIVQRVDYFGTFVGLTPAVIETLTDQQIDSLSTGSKFLFAGWFNHATMLWTLKASLLCFYARIPLGRWQQRLCIVSKYVLVVSYITVLLTIFLNCPRIQRNWQAKPHAEDLCTDNSTSFVVMGVLNVITDLFLLIVPIPLLWAVRLLNRRKIVIGILVCSGVFVLLVAVFMAVSRGVLPLLVDQSSSAGLIWAMRETLVAIIAISAPAIKPLFDKSCWVESNDGSNMTISSEISSLKSMNTNNRIFKSSSKDDSLSRARDSETRHAEHLTIIVTKETEQISSREIEDEELGMTKMQTDGYFFPYWDSAVSDISELPTRFRYGMGHFAQVSVGPTPPSTGPTTNPPHTTGWPLGQVTRS